jgi:hypothetical protein
MKASKLVVLVAAAALAVLGFATGASADTASTTSGYQVALTGPSSARVGQPTTYSATCGGGYACPYGEFRAFGGTINRLGEGFGTGAVRAYTFRAPGTYSIRYRVGASCPGSPRLACPIDVWLYTVVTA